MNEEGGRGGGLGLGVETYKYINNWKCPCTISANKRETEQNTKYYSIISFSS